MKKLILVFIALTYGLFAQSTKVGGSGTTKVGGSGTTKVSAVSGGITTFTDNFVRANANPDASSNWTQGTIPMKILSNTLQASADGGSAICNVISNSGAQTTQITIADSALGLVRAVGILGNANWTQGFMLENTGSTTLVVRDKANGNSVLATYGALTLVTGDVWKISINSAGTTITSYLNGASLGTCSPVSTPGTGSGGVYYTNTVCSINSFTVSTP